MHTIDSGRFSAQYFACTGAKAFFLASSGNDPIYNAVIGLRCIVQLSDHEGTLDLSQEHVSDLRAASLSLIPELARSVSKSVPFERVSLGLVAALSLLEIFGQPAEKVIGSTTLQMTLDQIDHVALLAAELDVIVRRGSIAERGDIFKRAVIMHQFARSTNDTGARLKFNPATGAIE